MGSEGTAIDDAGLREQRVAVLGTTTFRETSKDSCEPPSPTTANEGRSVVKAYTCESPGEESEVVVGDIVKAGAALDGGFSINRGGENRGVRVGLASTTVRTVAVADTEIVALAEQSS